MERHSFSINYNVSKEKKRKDGSIPINATINLNGIRASFSTGRKVLFEDWDSVKQRAKGNSEQAKLMNTFLLQVKNKLAKLELELLQHSYIITGATTNIDPNKNKKINVFFIILIIN